MTAKTNRQRARKREAQSDQQAILTSGDLTVKVERWGAIPVVLDAAVRSLLKQPVVRKELRRTQHRLLSVEWVEPENKAVRPTPPKRYRATIYDYTNNRTVYVDAQLDRPEIAEISESSEQPLPSREEFEAAVAMLQDDAEMNRAITNEGVRAYPPMPPLIESELPDGRSERIIAVGLLPSGTSGDERAPGTDAIPHQIVGVNLTHQAKTPIVRFEGNAPQRSLARQETCGFEWAHQATTRRGTAGNARVTVTQNNTVIWRFFVTRPSASSGRRGSGVELRFVDYRGKRVLYRAHVPILNVQYDRNACGPYRDWQWQEGAFSATGTDAAPGFRLCPSPAQTILDSSQDAGNFRGVAIYIQGQEVVLVSEMEAGWYRYISEWRLHADGTIRPRFGFTAVNTSSCVCRRHHHHVYWRLDFDIRTNVNNLVREFNDPPIVAGSNWHTIKYEAKRSRDASRKRKWRVENASTGEGYELIPGEDDGQADAFGRGDVWVLRNHDSEIDDGRTNTMGPPGYCEANIDRYLNGESLLNQDVMLWYAAHFIHDVHAPNGHAHGHIMGPELRPVNWG